MDIIDTPNDTESGQYMCIPDAARALGVTDRTLRRQIADGKHRVHVDDKGRKHVWLSAKAIPEAPPDGDHDDIGRHRHEMSDDNRTSLTLFEKRLAIDNDELCRVHRGATLARIAVFVLLVALVGISWYTSRLVLQSELAADAQQQQTEMITSLTERLEVAQAENRQLWDDKAAMELRIGQFESQLAEARSANGTLAARLDEAEAAHRTEQLAAMLHD